MRTINWKGIIYKSIENCKVKKEDDYLLVNSKIVGTFETKSYSVDYTLKINLNWEIQSFEFYAQVDTLKSIIKGNKINRGWEINKEIRNEFSNIDFIDISLSPFTNTLPINNLNIGIGEETTIKVIYLNILENKIEVLQQKYIRIAERKYKFENIPNNFEAEIEVDEYGFVIFYPKLFKQF
ncbi:putative glycolipid-binding domain-containing protein [Sphingobacterium kyonggiense]|uniref:Glycolipid-binding domain-containing protein n=1 Tax=Sphingobacterium kyonggiense TaxID=714075 RepID=A0ABP7YRS3_9SPHI